MHDNVGSSASLEQGFQRQYMTSHVVLFSVLSTHLWAATDGVVSLAIQSTTTHQHASVRESVMRYDVFVYTGRLIPAVQIVLAPVERQ
jgi:hypothetical protein